MTNYWFYMFSSIALVGATIVVFSKDFIRAILSLLIVFFATACVWLLLQAEFLALLLILVYAGALLIFFVFIVMLLINKKQKFNLIESIFYFSVFLSVAFVLFGVIFTGFKDKNVLTVGLQFMGKEVQHLGELLSSQYLFHLELAGMLLLASIVVVISLIRDK